MSDTAVLTAPPAAGAAGGVSTEAIAAAEAQQAAAMAATEQAALMALLAHQDGGEVDEGRSHQLSAEAVRQIIQAGRASLNLTDEQTEAVEEFLSEQISEMEPLYVERFVDSLAEAINSRNERELAGDEEEEREPDSPERQRRWATAAGRTLATRLAAETSLELAPKVEEQAGIKLNKLWMSRSDSKVRTAHRKLHGSAKPMDKPFWRELGTGKVLGFPGDPRAPIEQTINCRCWLWYVPEDKAAEAEDVFRLPDEEFDVPMAASGHGHGSIWELDDETLGAEMDVAWALTAASRSSSQNSKGEARQREFEEDKHKRGPGGRFAKSSGGADSDRGKFDYGEWVRRGGWDAVLARYKRKGKGKGSGSGSGGSSGGSGGGGDSAAEDQIAEEQETLRVEKERLREERRVNRETLQARRRSEDSARFGQRLSEDEALQQIRDDIKEVERERREAQRVADDLQRDIERSQDYIRMMRLKGELPEVIAGEQGRLAELQGKQKKATDLVDRLGEKSASLGTSDTVRRLRDRVRFSRRREDDQVRNNRATLDARIRAATEREDSKMRQREQDLRARKKALKGSGSPTSCIVALIPKGDQEITYTDGGTAPMHTTLGYLGDASRYDEIQMNEFAETVAGISNRLPPFTAHVAGRGTLGDGADEVAFIEAPELAMARDFVMTDDGLRQAIGGADEHPNWIPHITGLDDTEYQAPVDFDRIGLWAGDDRRDYPLSG